MSKRLSSGQGNTLLNYFQSPGGAVKKPDKNLNNENDDEQIKPVPKKRSWKRVIDTDSDSENVESVSKDESPKKGNKTKKETHSKKKRKRIVSEESSDEDDKQLETNKSKLSISEKLNVFSNVSKENIEGNTSLSTSFQNINECTSGGEWYHDSLKFLKSSHIRDLNKRPPDHPNYDKNTLSVPEDFLNKQTPAMRQWWILKSKHFDSILFFKVGKFYELYHMDAVIGVNHLSLSYMKCEFAHSGFPESAYGKMASSLIEQGFKVARVEQTETPEMMAERCKSIKKAGKFDKVVSREICQITTTGTCIYGAQLPDAKLSLPSYMLAIAEQKISLGSRFGVCFVDTSTGLFHLGDFKDDKHCSRILTLLSQHPPGLIITERGCMQNSTSELLKKTLKDVRKDTLAPNTQFYSAQTTLDLLMKGCYFRDKNDDFQWPLVLKDLIEDGVPKSEYELGLRALGACLWYLEHSKIDIQVLSMKRFELYKPIDMLMKSNELVQRDFMVLDSITIENLSLLGGVGTLQNTLDHCETAFGKRLLQQWICRPLCNEKKIAERQAAVQNLYSDNIMRQSARAILKKLPDLERQIAKIHTFGNKFCVTDHPDGRAVLYEAKTYSKRKIHDLLSTLQGFQKAQELTEIFANCESSLLKQLTQHPPSGKFVDLSNTLQFFKEAFDQKQAETDGKIIPQQGVDEEYDEAEQAISDLNEELEVYLREQEKLFGCKVKYFGTDKKRFQLEIPESKTKNIKSSYQLEGVKKGAKRYSTPVTRKFLADMIKAETKRNKILLDLNRRIFEKFSDRRDEWEQVTSCLMILDVLCAFAESASLQPRNICFPKVLPFDDKSFINIENGIHPCTLLDDFVPNNTQLGINDEAKIMLLTGPNMGGKSTLMRQVALIIIMAQMGCAVPATSCELSLVDRIFTRLGARDDIFLGQSTFLVEMSEAAAILQHATVHSFVLLDELGRGTSTHDGNAIATAYVNKLTDIQCRTMFSTHYHSLIEMFKEREDIQLAHMACMRDEDKDDDNDAVASVILLYQLRKGNCPKSYGFNAARLAGLPNSIIQCAYKVASGFESISKQRQLLRDLFSANDPNIARNIIKGLVEE